MLNKKADPVKKDWMEAYMRHQFSFFGVYALERKSIFDQWYKDVFSPHSKGIIEEVLVQLYAKKEREFHYIAADLFYKELKAFDKIKTEQLTTFLITTNSWWDTVDFLATSAVGKWLKEDPQLRCKITNKWMESRNIWLVRTAIIFQLKYKEETDEKLLEHVILGAVNYKDFFVQKAIGWALREYSKINPAYVRYFVKSFGKFMSPLAVRESLRYLKKKRISV